LPKSEPVSRIVLAGSEHSLKARAGLRPGLNMSSSHCQSGGAALVVLVADVQDRDVRLVHHRLAAV
jgi:hypothetical protein